jgi:hypothetical protein
MKQKIITLIFILFTFYSSKAQLIDSTLAVELITAEVTKIQYVFEGTIIKIELYPGDEEGNRIDTTIRIWQSKFGAFGYPNLSNGKRPYVYSIATIRVCQVYKGGENVYDTMKVITREDNVYISLEPDSNSNLVPKYNWGIPSRDLIFRDQFYKPEREGERQIFFAFNHSYIGVSTNIKILSAIGEINFWLYRYDPYSEIEADHIFASSGGPLFYVHNFFYSREEIYDFLEEIPLLNLNVLGLNVCDAEAFKEKKNPRDKGNIAEKKIKNNYQQNVKNYNEFRKRGLETYNTIQKRGGTKLNKAGEQLILEIANPRVTGPDNQPWLEFDILVSSNVGTTFFDNCLIHLSYDDSGSAGSRAFGTSIVSNINNNIEITRYGSFNTPTYINPQNFDTDQASDTLGIAFGIDVSFGPFNRVQLTTTPQKMLKVRMKIANKNRKAGINFVHLTNTSIFSLFALTNNATVIQTFAYSSTIRNGNNNDKTAKPIIATFNSPVTAGRDEVLTIVGKYFGGVASKNGTVFFKNANRGNVYPNASLKQGIDHFDIKKWSNDTIQIKIPNYFDSISVNPNDPDYIAVPGSGKFKVVNRFGVTTESTQVLTIPYSIIQIVTTAPTNKKAINLAGINNNGYVVHLNHSVVSAYPNARAVFKKALKNWSCVSGIKWELGKDTSLGINNGDGVCVVSMSSLSKFIALTTHEAYNCASIAYLAAFDMEIDNGVNWQLDTISTNNINTGKFDLYETIMHELGHCHLTDHNNDSLLDLMFWGGNKGPIPAANRKTVKTSLNSIDAAEYVAQFRITPTTCGAGTHIITIPLHCGSISNIEDVTETKGLKIYPNPVTYGILNIDFPVLNIGNMTFVVFDFMGKQIQRIESNEISGDSYKLNVENLAKGVYLLQVTTGSKQQSIKFIKG